MHFPLDIAAAAPRRAPRKNPGRFQPGFLKMPDRIDWT